MRLAGAFAAAAVLAAGPVVAGPWTQPRGEGQVIVKYEDMRADQGFDPNGEPALLPVERRDRVLSVFSEYGLTDRLTLQVKGDWQSGRDAFVDYQGRGPLEVGVTWQAWRDDRTALSVYAGVADAGQGRNAGYAAPGVGGQDQEVRVSLGRAFATPGARWTDGAFVDAQIARRFRQDLPDEVRADLTAGLHLGPDWMILNQAFAGMTDDDGARWLSVESSLVRRFGDWSVQAGWRQAVAGRETPIASGPVVGLWRRF